MLSHPLKGLETVARGCCCTWSYLRLQDCLAERSHQALRDQIYLLLVEFQIYENASAMPQLEERIARLALDVG